MSLARRHAALDLAPRVVGDVAQDRPIVIERLAHAAERVGQVPAAHATGLAG